MKIVLLAGGLGTRISEESHLRPKPMIEIGEKPILWHIMKIYSAHGFNEFIVCCGYKSYVIKEYFANYFLHGCDVTFDFTKGNNSLEVHSNFTDPWKITLVDTGLDTMTGGRIMRIRQYVEESTFMLTYGDGVSDIDLEKLLWFHQNHGKYATVTAVSVGQRFGVLDITNEGRITSMREKSDDDGGVINAGFMVLEPEIFNYITNDSTIFERGPLERLAAEGQLMAYKHDGFWQCMDTQRDKLKLEEYWASQKAPWRKW
jgi:glucose-1-phosphate cytidylyltransferase